MSIYGKIIEENAKDDTGKFINDNIETFYEHALKYKHNPQKQSTIWLYTILGSSGNIEKYYTELPKSEKNKLKSMSTLYNDGMRKAVNAGNIECKNKYDVFKEFESIDAIINREYLLTWLRSNAYTYEVKRYLSNAEINLSYLSHCINYLCKGGI